MTKQERLQELLYIKKQHEAKIEILEMQMRYPFRSDSSKSDASSLLHQRELMMYKVRRNSLQPELDKYNALLSNVEKEICKIEAMSDSEAQKYISEYERTKRTLKALEVLSDMTPEPIGGRWVRVSDNFVIYWLIVVIIGSIITFIVLGINS